MSDDTPDTPYSPECLLSMVLTWWRVSSSMAMSQGIVAGSRSPERVPITSPSSGVKPMEVSTLRPRSTAATEAPLPR